ncbi:MAG: hypothetical protein WCD69_22395 [Xanthobacteraceae bacterium]
MGLVAVGERLVVLALLEMRPTTVGEGPSQALSGPSAGLDHGCAAINREIGWAVLIYAPIYLLLRLCD